MTFFADSAISSVVPLLENQKIAADTMRLRVSVPEMASRVAPGQFFMIRNPAGNDPLIGRALALYDAAGDGSGWIDLVYLVKGKLTSSLARLQPGAPIAIWGPLGNGFSPRSAKHLILVAGGIGQTPFLTLAKEALGRQQFALESRRVGGYAERVTFCYGVRSARYLAGLEQFEQAGCEVLVATDDGTRPDGSQGKPELVTDVLRRVLAQSNGETRRIVCCGPEPMMEAVCEIATENQVDCEVSLETPMACGIGLCFSCVAKIGTADDWDYKRTCVEGPVFDARQIVWH
jgi:dihydroorotate dehydrogenase electron transfer subunit